VGWVTNWREMVAEPGMRIGRPRQLYVGPAQRAYVPIENRSA
jgi:citrate synthase